MAGVRVGFDATSLLGVRTGVGHVTAGFLDAASRYDDLEIVAFAVTWRGTRDLPAVVPSGVIASPRRTPARAMRPLWSTIGRPRAEHWTGPVDVVHAPNFVAPPARAPVVVTIHDLTYLRAPELCGPDVADLDTHVRRAIHDGAHVHAVSDFVAADVRDAYGVAADRVTRIYAGLLPSASGDPDVGRALAGAQRYVLALGALDPRKNLVRLIEAFDRVAGDDPELALVVAGPDGASSAAVTETIGAARHGDRVRRIGYVEDTERRALLAGATALAYPSITEGFGHPPLEAMQAGVPVIASSGGALPEVLGDAALLPDPTDVEAIADALRQVVRDDDLRTRLVDAGHARASRYDWDRSGSELVDLYRWVTGARRP